MLGEVRSSNFRFFQVRSGYVMLVLLMSIYMKVVQVK
jgi:CRISPR/Cas system-associated protein endoribonuclease Cas2